MSQHKQGDIIYVYLVVFPNVVSIAIVKEGELEQKLVYHTSQAFWWAKSRYPQIEMMIAFVLLS